MLLRGDPVRAFVDYPGIAVASAPAGPLAGKTLAVKDLYDVAGYPTGGGHPLLRKTGAIKSAHAPAVAALLAAGARFVGKTHTDEFAYAMNGENAHYGTPINPRAPGRIPGGSSSGSAAAVAAGIVDIALGSDTGGSIRLPASYCGLIGLRTTHSSISIEGVQPLATSFDTVGWFARDLDTYAAVATVLLGDGPAEPVRRLLVADDISGNVLGDTERAETERCLARIAEQLPIEAHVRISEHGFEEWRQVFRTIQAYEAWRSHGRWIETHEPALGDGIRERFEWARTVTAADYASALREREAIASHIGGLVPPGTALIFPTAPSVAPVVGRTGDELEAYRAKAISMMCSAGLAGLPQLSLPLGTIDGLPFGLSLLGWAGSDLSLLAAARELLTDQPPSRYD
jgi:amidase